MLYVVLVIHGLFWLRLLPGGIGSAVLFEMPCIFIVSGYAYRLYRTGPARPDPSRDASAYLEFLSSRLTRILIPYFAYVLFAVGIILVRRPDWSGGDLFMAWFNPVNYGRGYSILVLNWHLWFVTPFLAVAALLPFLARIRIRAAVPLWAYMAAAAFIIYLISLGWFKQMELFRNVVFYSLWAVFGYHLAASDSRLDRRDYLSVFVLALAALAAMWLLFRGDYSLDMQANKFPPNFVFFIFSCAWVALLLTVVSWLPKDSVAILSRQFWLKPFITHGYSIYLWQGAGYSIALFIATRLHFPILVTWFVALALTLLLGTLAAPLERLRIRRSLPRVPLTGTD